MDAFYASVEERERPELAGQPVVVGGSPEGRGVVAAANYKARQFGIHSAMPASTALKRCPDLIVLPVRMSLYAGVSHQIHQIFTRYTPQIEPLSLDEAFLDVSASQRLFGSAETIARRIKQEIREELSLVASVGVAPNKFLAKIASDLDKPDGYVVVDPGNIQAFLDPLPISRLWGVGKVAASVFNRLGIHTIGRVRQLAPSILQQHFGKLGTHFLELAHGIDPRPVVTDCQAKSISNEVTFDVDINDPPVLRACLLQLTEQVAWRLRQHDLRGRTINIKVRFSDFKTITRSFTLSEPSNTTSILWQTALELLTTRLPHKHLPVRLLGMGVSGFQEHPATQKISALQYDLFAEAPAKQREIDIVADEINVRFGASTVKRGLYIKHTKTKTK